MTIYAICGPIGSKIKPFAVELANQIGTDSVLLIDESNYKRSDLTLNADLMLAAIGKAKSDVIVFGHDIFMFAGLREKLTTKIYMDTDLDTLLADYIRENKSSLPISYILDTYENIIKLQNEGITTSSKQFADMVIMGYPQNNHIFNILKNSSDKAMRDIEEKMQQQKGIAVENTRTPSFFG